MLNTNKVAARLLAPAPRRVNGGDRLAKAVIAPRHNNERKRSSSGCVTGLGTSSTLSVMTMHEFNHDFGTLLSISDFQGLVWERRRVFSFLMQISNVGRRWSIGSSGVCFLGLRFFLFFTAWSNNPKLSEYQLRGTLVLAHTLARQPIYRVPSSLEGQHRQDTTNITAITITMSLTSPFVR